MANKSTGNGGETGSSLMTSTKINEINEYNSVLPLEKPVSQLLPTITTQPMQFQNNIMVTTSSTPQQPLLITETTARNEFTLTGNNKKVEDDNIMDTTIHVIKFEEQPSSVPNEMGLFENFEEDEIDVHLENPDDNYASVTKFEDLAIPDYLLRGLYSMNYRKPSKIQEKALPLLMRNPPTNMIAQSQSGTGKTAAFVLTMLCRIDPDVKALQGLCLANTRELAIQINAVVEAMASQTTIRSSVAVSSGSSKNNPRESRGQRSRSIPESIDSQIIIGTPGSVLGLANRHPGVFSQLKVFVLDEADAMLAAQNLGDQSYSILQIVQQELEMNQRPPPQILLFSATFGERVTVFADSFAPGANRITLRREEVKVEGILQFALRVPQSAAGKLQQLAKIYGLLTVGQSIVFVQRRETAYIVQSYMEKNGHSVSVLTSDEDPSVRDSTMVEFRSGRSKVLVATNVLARGIDVPQVNLVVNYDMPEIHGGRADHESYVHRIGRTGRFGRQGIAINFIDGEGAQRVQDEITRAFSMKVAEMPNDVDDMEQMLKKFKI